MQNSKEEKSKWGEADFAKALVRMEDKYRKTNVRDFMADSVMSDHQWFIYIELKRELASRKLTLLAGVLLTAIIDPKKYPMSNALWRRSVLFAIITLAPIGVVRILVLDDNSKETKHYLDKLGVQYIEYNSLLKANEFSKIVLDEIDFQFQSAASTKSLINRSENDVADSLRESVSIIEYERFHFDKPREQNIRRYFEIDSVKLLHEVALHRICKGDLLGSLLKSEGIHICATSSVDILMHAPPPLNQPLLAIEFDGPYHASAIQQSKDRLKDIILAHYRIPLIRISHTDAAFGNLSRDGKTKLHRLYIQVLTKLVSTVIWQKEFETNFAISTDKAKKALFALENQFAISQFGKRYVDLNKDEKLAVNDTTFYSSQEEECTFENALYNYERDNVIERAKEEAEWPKELLQYSLCPEIHGSKLTGFWATFKVDIPRKTRLEVTVPKIWIQANSLDDEILNACVTSNLLQIAAEMTRQIIRMNTPASRE